MAMTTVTPLEAVTNQYREEAKDLKFAQDQMLRQKYGLVEPVLTLSEQNLIRREERTSGR